MNDIKVILCKLDNIKISGKDQWTAKCPAHDDEHNSLSIRLCENGKVLLKCFAGCGYPEIAKALERKNTLSSVKKDNEIVKSIVAIYPYPDEYNKILFRVIKTFPKGFFQQKPDGKGNWINGLKGVRTVIYNLPNVMSAIKEGKEIYIVEGEKDADRLNGIGLIATTSPMGASNWKDEYAQYFIRANVVIIPDNDEPGRKYAQKIIKSLEGKVENIKLLELPGQSEKEDVSDWLDKGNTVEELRKLIDNALYYDTKKEIISANSIEEKVAFPCTDLGNAERLVKLVGNDIRYCYEANCWLVWNGMRWEWDKTGEIERKAKETVRSIYKEAAEALDRSERREIAEWAKTSESSRAIKAMINLAESEKGISISRDQLDSNDWLLNCLNGTIDLRTGELKEHNRADFLTMLAPVTYDPNAKSEVFDKFLERILPDEELRRFIQIAAGYSMTGDTSEEKLFFAYGPAASGKSTLFTAIKTVLGEYASTTDFDTFLERKSNGSPRNDLARLKGKRFVLGSEVDEGKKLAESLVKQITGNDTITARYLHQEFFEFKPKMKLWLAANFRPRVNDNDAAMWRRILQAPFTVHIPKEERDPKVKQILSDPNLAGPAILTWLVEGCLKWQKEGLRVPQIVEDFTNEYKEEMDPLKEFLVDACIINPLAKSFNSDLWNEYETWCKENGERFPLGRKKFTQRLESRGFTQERSASSRFWKGIGLKEKKSMTDMTGGDTKNNKIIKDFSYIRENMTSVSQVSKASLGNSALDYEQGGEKHSIARPF